MSRLAIPSTVCAGLLLVLAAPPACAQSASSQRGSDGTRAVPAPDFEPCMKVNPRLMLQRADSGDAHAEFCAGYYYMQGAAGIPKNEAEGVRYFRRAAEHGYVKANGYLGRFYKHGNGVARDYREAERWYRRGAELGDPGAQNDLAVLLLDGGPGVKQNKEEAVRWARKAAEQNYPQAFNLLAAIQAHDRPARKEPAQGLLEEGRRLFESGNHAAAARPFLAAAQAGNSAAQLQIGWHYENGVGVQQSSADAARWYRKSAEQGNSRAMKNLGQFYENGTGVPEDWVEAARWYRKSAEEGDRDGESALARAYQFGVGVPQNRKLAIQWDERAAAQGDGQAAYFARWLRDPTNNIGFRNDYEHRLVMAGRLRFGGALIGGDPAGLTFRNSRERLAWLLLQRKELDHQEAYTMWSIARDEYERCRRGSGQSCRDPGPPPR
jgi:TPR repeat protein